MNSLTVLKLSVVVALLNAADVDVYTSYDGTTYHEGTQSFDGTRNEVQPGTLKQLFKRLHLERALNPFKAGVDGIMVIGPAKKAIQAGAKAVMTPGERKAALIEAVGEAGTCTKDVCTLVILGNCVAPATTAACVGATVAGGAAGIATIGSVVGGVIEGGREFQKDDKVNGVFKISMATAEALTAGLAGLPRFAPFGASVGKCKFFINVVELAKNLTHRCSDDGTGHVDILGGDEEDAKEPVKRALVEMVADLVSDDPSCIPCAAIQATSAFLGGPK